MNALFFWFFSFGMIICALAVVLNRNAVASALCFTFTIVFMSGLFVMLSAFFLAAVQILVTAGAVMVLFLFIIMLLDLSKMEHMPRPRLWMGCTLILTLAFLVLVARTLHDTPQGFVRQNSLGAPRAATLVRAPAGEGAAPDQVSTSEEDQQDDTHRIGRLLFATHVGPYQPSYVAPFEITSLLILVATIGVIVLCKREEPGRPSPRDQIAREAPPIDPKKEAALKT